MGLIRVFGDKMAQFLKQKCILVGITGSIAAYKSADLVRRLREAGAQVRVAMTENAKRFITPLTLQAVSGNPVHDDLFDLEAEAAMGHIELARWADIVVIAPATADFVAKLVHGEADDLLTTLCLATQAPIAIAPAMNQGMWRQKFTQENFATLAKKKVLVLGPGEGNQACGDVGPGRMLEVPDIVTAVDKVFASGKLAGVPVLITAGPTHEAIDPIRYITNHSSGKMGYALAQAAKEAGAIVTLVSGPVALKAPEGVEMISVVTAEEMNQAVLKMVKRYDIFMSVAAVGDYRCETIASEKIHKQNDTLILTLLRNPDIVENVGRLPHKPYIVGFAAETENVLKSADRKRQHKKMDMIVANQVGKKMGMGTDDNQVTIMTEKNQLKLPRASKDKIARGIIAEVAKHFKKRDSHGKKSK